MSKRIRLTQRKAADMSVPYPGNVNQPDRTDPAWDKYHTFEQTVNHELPDMRHEWKDDQRDDIGFGIPEDVKNPGAAPIGKATGTPPAMTASRVAANKAVKLAVLLLGEKVPEDVIEQQARDFLSIDREAMDRTLSRFASTQKFYAEDEEDVEEDDDAKEASSKKADSAELAEQNSTVPPAIQTPANPQVADKTAKSKKAEAASAAPAAPAPAAPAAPAPAEADKTACADADADDADTKAPGEMDIELQGAMDDEPEEDAEADAKLARIFEGDAPPPEDEDVEPVVAKSKTAKKSGITRLGGQPKVASEDGADPKNLSNLWATAPDVSEVFR